MIDRLRETLRALSPSALGCHAHLRRRRLLLLFGLNMRRGLNHDEQQFVASGVLLARDGLRPYADFAYFHVPAQTLLYALLFRLFDQFLLTARSVSVLAGWLSLALIYLLALAFAPFRGAWSRFGFAAAFVLLLMATPLVVHTSGRAWNHDLPFLLTLLAFVATLQGLGHDPPRRATGVWLAAAGACLGLAAATRLSYAFLAPAFVAALWLRPGWPARRKGTATLWLALGGLLGTLPAWALWLDVAGGFWFGNVTYNLRLNPLYYSMVGDGRAMTLVGKLSYLAELAVTRPANLLLPALFALALLPVLARIDRRTAPGLVLVLLCLPFALAGALSATPSQPQYYFVLYPFFALGVVFAAALCARQPGRWAWRLAWPPPWPSPPLPCHMQRAPRWSSSRRAGIRPRPMCAGSSSAAWSAAGQVLTMAPIHALEGGVPIYPAFVTGPLAWRVAPFLAPEERTRYGLAAEADFAGLVEREPPRGVLVGFESSDRDFEAVLLDYTRRHGYVPVTLPDEGELWLRPLATWNGAIRLGAHTLPQQAVAPGSTLDVTFYEQKFGPIDRNLNVLVRVVGADGREIARSEGWPYGSATASWPEGAVWPDGHRLAVGRRRDPRFLPRRAGLLRPGHTGDLRRTRRRGLPRRRHAAPVLAMQRPAPTFADGVRLLSAALPEESLPPGGAAEIESRMAGNPTDHRALYRLRPPARPGGAARRPERPAAAGRLLSHRCVARRLSRARSLYAGAAAGPAAGNLSHGGRAVRT